MPVQDFLRGYPLRPGERLGKSDTDRDHF
jgi:hypothetical protein